MGGLTPYRASPRLVFPPKEGVPLGLGQGLGTEYSLRESLWDAMATIPKGLLARLLAIGYWLDYW